MVLKVHFWVNWSIILQRKSVTLFHWIYSSLFFFFTFTFNIHLLRELNHHCLTVPVIKKAIQFPKIPAKGLDVWKRKWDAERKEKLRKVPKSCQSAEYWIPFLKHPWVLPHSCRGNIALYSVAKFTAVSLTLTSMKLSFSDLRCGFYLLLI